MDEQRSNLTTNIIRSTCAAGTVEHAWLPGRGELGYVSVSAPSGICLTFGQNSGCIVTIAGKRLQRNVERACVSIAGPEPINWHVVPQPSDVVEVTATKAVRGEIAEEMGIAQESDLEDMHGGTDPVIWAIAARIRTSLRTPGQGACLEYEELIWRLYRHVFATRFGGRPSKKGDGKLDRRRFRRVVTYIEEHLKEGSLSIAALSDVASMSPFHFLRSFQRTLYMTPHQYVRARRLEHIRIGLTAGEDVRTIASQYGFRHMRHFQSEYCRHHGLAPGTELAEILWGQ